MTSEDDFVTSWFLEKHSPWSITMLKRASPYPAAPSTVQTSHVFWWGNIPPCVNPFTPSVQRMKYQGLPNARIVSQVIHEKAGFMPSHHLIPRHPPDAIPAPSNPTPRGRREADVIGRETQHWISRKHCLQSHCLLPVSSGYRDPKTSSEQNLRLLQRLTCYGSELDKERTHTGPLKATTPNLGIKGQDSGPAPNPSTTPSSQITDLFPMSKFSLPSCCHSDTQHTHTYTQIYLQSLSDKKTKTKKKILNRTETYKTLLI